MIRNKAWTHGLIILAQMMQCIRTGSNTGCFAAFPSFRLTTKKPKPSKNGVRERLPNFLILTEKRWHIFGMRSKKSRGGYYRKQMVKNGKSFLKPKTSLNSTPMLLKNAHRLPKKKQKRLRANGQHTTKVRIQKMQSLFMNPCKVMEPVGVLLVKVPLKLN